MWSTRLPGPLRLELQPSRLLILLLGGGHLLALAVIPFLDFPLSVRLLLVLSLGVSLGTGLWRHGVGARRVATVIVSTEGSWTLIEAGGRTLPVQLVGHYLHPRLVVLTFAAGLWRRSVVLPPDCAPAQDLRRLRVRLRTARHEPEDP